MFFHGLLRFFRGGGMRPIAAVALSRYLIAT
jgi:hypothetical protein